MSLLMKLAVSTRIMTKKGCERIVRAAFEYARHIKENRLPWSKNPMF
jgi:isocitrate/isopropylmalate dehydrogenase